MEPACRTESHFCNNEWGVTFADLCVLTSLPNLQYLDIRETLVDVDGHIQLSEFASLQALQLSGQLEPDSEEDNALKGILHQLTLLTHLRVDQMQ